MTQNNETNSTAVSVRIEPEVLALMVGHATSHSTTTIHGILVGTTTRTTTSKNRMTITDAYPICHETPTKVLVETSLSLVQSKLEESSNNHDNRSSQNIVGWYTAPELGGDNAKPSPVVLRIVASLAALKDDNTSQQPVLLVLNNDSLVKVIQGQLESLDPVVTVYGKDFGNQWLEKLDHEIDNEEDHPTALELLVRANETKVNDLTDHWEAGTNSEWTTATNIRNFP
jgi:hypothetical protein